MRTRKEIDWNRVYSSADNAVIIELLLDIRDLLGEGKDGV